MGGTEIIGFSGKDRHWPRLFDKPATYLSLLLVALALLPALDTTVRYYYHQESYNNYQEQLPEAVELSGGQEFIQKINIKGLFTRLAICLDTYGRENSGNIEISIIKDGRQIHSRSLPMSSLKAGRQILELGDWWKPRHIQGPVELKIRAAGGAAGSSAGLVLSNGLYYGQLSHGGQILQKNLLVAVNSRTVPPLSLIRLGLFVALAVLVQLAIVSIFSPRPNERRLFWLSFLIILLSLCHKFPLLTFMAEPCCEAGSNFFKLTAERPWRESVFIEDFSYWPLFQRLISKFYLKVFGWDKWAFSFMYMTMTVLLAATCSMFCLKAYSRYMKKEFRFICCVFFGVTSMVSTQGVLLFITVVYFGLLYLFMIAMLDLNALSRRVYVLVLFSSIICISKAHYILLIPFALACLAYCLIKRKNRRLGLFAASVLIASAIQLVYVIWWASLHPNFSSGAQHFLLISAEKTLYFFSSAMMKSFLVPPNFDLAQQSGYLWHFMALCITVVIFLYCIRQITDKQIPHKIPIIMLIALSLAIISLFFALIAQRGNHMFNFVLWRDMTNVFIVGNRQIVFVFISLTMVAILFFSLVAKWPKGEWLLCFLFMIYMVPRAQTINGYALNIRYATNLYAFERSDWREYYKSFRRGSYAIPMLTTRFIVKNAELLYAGSSKDIDQYVWNYTVGARPVKLLNDADNIGSRADLSDVAELGDRNIIALYAKKTGSTQTAEVTAVFRDRNNAILARVPAANGYNRQHIGFIPEKPIKNMAWLEFVDQDDFPVDMSLDYYFGVEKF